MIVAERKPFDEIKTMLAGSQKVFILGCDTCVSVCMAGGKKEVGLLASQLRMSFKKDGRDIQIDEDTVERQCNREYMELVLNKLQDYDLVVSMACGAGVQLLADLSEPLRILPGVNTRFIGMTLGRHLGRAMQGLRGLRSGGNRRHLPGDGLRQGHFKRPLRRHRSRQVRSGQGKRLRLDPDLSAP